MNKGFVQLPLVSTTAHGVEGARDDWCTPQALFDMLDGEFRFDVDCAASESNAKADWYMSEEDDALSLDWSGATCWLNPPYGRGVGDWVEKAYVESQKGATVVVLVFARTDTAWWHDYAMKAKEIRLIRGRLRFLQDGKERDPAPAPSCVIVFAPGEHETPVFTSIGRGL